MSRLVIALVVGAALGLGIWFGFRSSAPAGPAAVQSNAGTTRRDEPGSSTGGTAWASPARPGLIVVVSRRGKPEPTARLELLRAEVDLTTSEQAWRPAGAERTDDAGRATFPALAGHYLVVATAADATRAVKIFDVGRASASTHVDLELAPPRRLEGRVIDGASGKPIEHATIRADPDTQPALAVATATSDSFGRFGLELPQAETWRIEARAPGWISNAEVLTRAPVTVELKLTAGVALDGLVVSAAGEPIGDATLHVMPGDVTSLVSDRTGHFAITVPPGAVSLHALAPDGSQGLERVVTKEGTARTHVQIVLTTGFTLQGLVHDEVGPAAGAEVRIIAEPEDLEVAALQAGPDGRFEAKRLPKGRYSVRARQGLGQRATVVGVELPGASPVDLALSKAGHVVGVVIDDAQTPVVGATVTLSWPSGMPEIARTAITGDDGRFDFDDLFPSEVAMQARLDDLVSEEIGTYVAPGTTAEVTLAVGSQGRLEGTVEAETPVDQVLLRGWRGSGRFRISNELAMVVNGRFEQRLAPGAYLVLAKYKGRFVETSVREEAVVRSGEVTTVVVRVVEGDGGIPAHANMMHSELGSGLSFENSPGGVRVDFLMSDCPAARAGVQIGDLVVSIDGEPTRDALDAFARVRKPSGEQLRLQVRRDGKDLPFTLK